jgi:hypothetical protein
MSNRTALLVGTLLLETGLLLAQIPPEERIPIRDPDRLEALGFPRDAQNVYVWSKADLKASLLKRSEDFRPARPETFGTLSVGYSNVLGITSRAWPTASARWPVSSQARIARPTHWRSSWPRL